MTRGKFAIILDDGIYTSYEFNGDMYYDGQGHGPEVIERLGRVNNKEDFVREVEEFNDKEFQYGGEFTEPFFIEKVIDFQKSAYFEKYFSDYIYVKNLTSDTQKIIDYNGNYVEIEPNQILTFCFGEIENHD